MGNTESVIERFISLTKDQTDCSREIVKIGMKYKTLLEELNELKSVERWNETLIKKLDDLNLKISGVQVQLRELSNRNKKIDKEFRELRALAKLPPGRDTLH